MKNSYLKDALENSLPAIASDDAFAIDLMDADLDAIAGGSAAICGVMKVNCETSYSTGKVGREVE